MFSLELDLAQGKPHLAFENNHKFNLLGLYLCFLLESVLDPQACTLSNFRQLY